MINRIRKLFASLTLCLLSAVGVCAAGSTGMDTNAVGFSSPATTFIVPYGYDFISDNHYHVNVRTSVNGNLYDPFVLSDNQVAFIEAINVVGNPSSGFRCLSYTYFTADYDDIGDEWELICTKSLCAVWFDVDISRRTNVHTYGFPYVFAESDTMFFEHWDYLVADYPSINFFEDDDDETPRNFFFCFAVDWFVKVIYPAYWQSYSDMLDLVDLFGDERYSAGKAEGRLIGYNEGRSSVSSEATSIMGLFTAIAGVPIQILNGLGAFTIWDVPIISIISTFLVLAIFAFVIRKFI